MAQAVLLVLLMAVFVAPSEAAQGAVEHKTVLLLFSEESNLRPQTIVEQTLRSTLRNSSPVRVEIYSEYLDSFRTRVDGYEKELMGLLRNKYEGRRFDLIIAVLQPALGVLLRNQSEIFPDTPIVFLVLDQRNVARLNLGPNVTGVWGEVNLKPNLDLALALHSNTRKIVVIAGVSEFDKYWTAEAREDFRAYDGKLEITYLIGLTVPEQQRALASLPPNTIVMFATNTRDNAGNNHANLDVLRQISPASKAPIYGFTDAQLGLGIVGGSILSFEAMGAQAAGVGLRILAGEKPQTIAPHGVPNLVMFDWRELRRWGIDENKLPAGSVVRFKEPTFWQQHKWQIIGVISLCIVEALLIAFLLVSRSRQKRAEAERERFAALAEAGHRRLDEVVSNVPGLVWESRLESDGTTRRENFVSQHVEKLLGYTVQEWLSQPRFWLSIIPEDERDEALRQNDAVFQSGKDGVIQFRWLAKDGRLLWVEAHLSVIFDDQGAPIGLRGVTLDITDRKMAEWSLRESEERNRAILRAIPDLMFLQTKDGVFLDFHATGPDALFVPPHEFLGRNMRDVLPAQLVEDLFKAFRLSAETGEPQTLEYLLPTNNEELWFEARIVYTDGDNVLSVVRNVTERKRVEESLRESAARFRMMADTAPMMVWMSGTDKLCTFFNRSWLEFTGRPIEKELGDGWTQGVHADDYNQCLNTYVTAFDERKGFRMEYRLKRFDGEYRWIFDEGVPRYTPEGSFAGYIGACVDLTERRKAEEALRNALSEVGELKDQLQQENLYLRDEIRLEYDFQEIVGNSDEIKYVLFKIQQVAPTDATVLILGETGTGKELVARAIHGASTRKDRPLVKINCATLPATLIESELFGHEKGAFTGALAKKIGRFEVADGATLFLDEIGELPLELQSKLLRVLQDGEFERLGSSQTRRVDVRIIAATNRNLRVEVQNGLFRKDLWYRLNVFPITVPPLRQRKRDVASLVSFFVNRFNRKLGRIVNTIPPRTLQSLEDYAWPGNVRELANVVERAIINSDSTVLRLADKLEIGPQSAADDNGHAQRLATLEHVERDHITSILNTCDWRIEGQGGAAEILGINSSTLRSRMTKLRIQRPGRSSAAAGPTPK